uniref:Reverse transcriptase zinc-binding domain-containing protein n=1 Tax=Triticum urartu TaxID=4572 RepID=A0A8R7VIC8_TRIUA
KALFIASTCFILGDGTSVSFWHDHWLNGGVPALVFPNLYKHSKKRKITVNEGLTNSKWISLIKHNPDVDVLSEFINLWHRTRVVLLFEREDVLNWKWTMNGKYYANSAYLYQFWGRIEFPFQELIWQIKIPPKVQFFAWLVVQGKCLTADNLAKRG